MFLFLTAMMLGLIAFAVGVVLVVWSMRNQGVGSQLAKVFGYIIIVAAILGQLGSFYYAKKYSDQGYFDRPNANEHGSSLKIDIL